MTTTDHYLAEYPPAHTLPIHGSVRMEDVWQYASSRNVTLAKAIAELINKGLDYLDDHG